MRDPSQQESADRAARQDLLLRARTLYQAGAVTDAWETCARLAELSRMAGDHAALADAATVIRPIHNSAVTGRVSKLGRSSRAGIASWYATSGS